MLSTVVLAAAFGLVAPLLAPSLLKHTRYADRVGNAYGAFTAKALKRPAIGVGKHGDLSLRQLSFDQVYDQEVVEVGDVEKKITRSAKNVHRFGKTPFAFFDEVFGVTFDLRDVLIGNLERQHRDDGEMVYHYEEFNDRGEPVQFDRFVRAFFEVEDRQALELDLDESVRPIVDGSERASWWKHMYEAVKRMYIHRQEETSLIRMLLPFIVSGCAFALGYYVLGPGRMPWSGGGGGGLDPVTVGAPLLLAAPDVDLPDWAPKAALGVTTLGLALLVTIVVGPVLVGIALIGFVIGAMVLPVLTLILGAVGYGSNLADLFMWAGLQAFDEPVVDLTANDQYRFAEANELGLEHVPKVRLSKTLVGLSCDVSPEAFGRAGNTSADLMDYLPDDGVAADGGEDAALPRGYTPTNAITNAGIRGFLPTASELSSDTTYVRTDNWLSRFKNAATGDSLDVAETEATNEFADGNAGFTDGQIMTYSAIGSAVALGFWVVVALAF